MTAILVEGGVVWHIMRPSNCKDKVQIWKLVSERIKILIANRHITDNRHSVLAIVYSYLTVLRVKSISFFQWHQLFLNAPEMEIVCVEGRIKELLTKTTAQ